MKIQSVVSLIISVILMFSVSAILTSCKNEPLPSSDITTARASDSTAPTEATSEKPIETTALTVAETTMTEAVKTVPVTLRVGSYNIKHGADAGLDLSKIGQVIKEAGLDIVGIQEVDYKTTRANYADQPKLLSEASEMPYYKFTRAISYQGGQYGTLILSKYPITEFELKALTSGDEEARSVGHAVIDVNGYRVDFFNTHLVVKSSETRQTQFKQISAWLQKCQTYILTGDFNTQNFNEFSPLNYGKLLNNVKNKIVTFPASGAAIDNIVLSDNITISDFGTVTQSYSDHYLLWSEVVAEIPEH